MQCPAGKSGDKANQYQTAQYPDKNAASAQHGHGPGVCFKPAGGI